MGPPPTSNDDLVERGLKRLKGGHYDPANLRRSIPGFVACLMRSPRRFLNAMEIPEVYMPQVDYSSTSTKIQKALEQLTAEWNVSGELGVTFKKVTPARGAFDAGINMEFALSAQSLFLFPFYLSEFRRHLFGVVPYGQHVSVGLCLHESNPLVQSFDIKGDFATAALTVNSPQASAKRLAFLTELFTQASTSNLKIQTKDNFLNREILPLLKANAQHGLLVSTFSKTRFVDTVSDFEGSLFAEDRRNTVYLYDLASDAEKFDNPNGGFVSIPFLHDLAIPVGIGFSIPALPIVARQIPGLQKTVAEALLDTIKTLSRDRGGVLAQELWKQGTLLDRDFRFVSPEKLEALKDDRFAQAINSQQTMK
jgi:hypothetical protein